jgi:hypothetical protein
LKQIQQGIIRFSPSKPYIELEKRQHKKERGDFLEGEVKFSCVKQTLKNFDTGETIFLIFQEISFLQLMEQIKFRFFVVHIMMKKLNMQKTVNHIFNARINLFRVNRLDFISA